MGLGFGMGQQRAPRFRPRHRRAGNVGGAVLPPWRVDAGTFAVAAGRRAHSRRTQVSEGMYRRAGERRDSRVARRKRNRQLDASRAGYAVRVPRLSAPRRHHRLILRVKTFWQAEAPAEDKFLQIGAATRARDVTAQCDGWGVRRGAGSGSGL